MKHEKFVFNSPHVVLPAPIHSTVFTVLSACQSLVSITAHAHRDMAKQRTHFLSTAWLDHTQKFLYYSNADCEFCFVFSPWTELDSFDGCTLRARRSVRVEYSDSPHQPLDHLRIISGFTSKISAITRVTVTESSSSERTDAGRRRELFPDKTSGIPIQKKIYVDTAYAIL